MLPSQLHQCDSIFAGRFLMGDCSRSPFFLGSIITIIMIIGLLSFACSSSNVAAPSSTTVTQTSTGIGLTILPPSQTPKTTSSPSSVSTTVTTTAPPTWETATDPAVNVHVNIPSIVSSGTDFVAGIAIGQVNHLVAYQFRLTYDPAVIQISGSEGGDGVAGGTVGSLTMPIDLWMFSPAGQQGTMDIIGHFRGTQETSGTGDITEIHFHVIGNSGSSSDVKLSRVELFNAQIQLLNTTVASGSVSIGQ